MNPPNLKEMSDAQLQAIVDLTEARILNISKDDLRMSEIQLIWDAELENEVKGYWEDLNTLWRAKKLPPCTCADHEKNGKTGVGFMADPRYNPFYFNGEPCSLEHAKKFPELFNKWRKS